MMLSDWQVLVGGRGEQLEHRGISGQEICMTLYHEVIHSMLFKTHREYKKEFQHHPYMTCKDVPLWSMNGNISTHLEELLLLGKAVPA
jgi:hypothetical protein